MVLTPLKALNVLRALNPSALSASETYKLGRLNMPRTRLEASGGL